MKTFKQYIKENIDAITIKGKTARPWKSTSVYKAALDGIIQPGDRVLDYGSGPEKYQKVKQHIINLGAEYYPYDSFNNIGSLVGGNDVVMGSNVLNTQVYEDDPLKAYNNALDEMKDALSPTGTLVVNMPSNGPMADWMTPAQLNMDLMDRFNNVQRIKPGVFAASNPK
tara:strand:+ start:1041 stop:1547 length:507 start_codon:yes stop_codon:yes gene_type:complete